MSGARAKANRIGLGDGAKAVAWLKQRPEEAARRPQAEIAAALAEYLRRPVTVQNLQTIATAAEVRLHGYSDETQDRLAAQVQALRELVERLSLELLSTSQATDKRLATLEGLVTQPAAEPTLGEGVQP